MKANVVFVYLLGIAVCITACAKVEVSAPEFEVVTEQQTIQAGSDVRFTFSGDPDQITFYSGEPLNDYAYKDGRVLNINNLMTSFRSNVQYGTQANLLSVWVSSDYSGGGTIKDVRAATWSDELTKNFVLAPHSMNTNAAASAVPSGVIDLLAAADGDKPLYLGFRYKKLPDAEAGGQRNWFIRELAVKAQTDLGESELVNGLALQLVYDENFTPDDPALKNSAVNAAGVLTIRVPNGLGALHTEVWAVTPPISVGSTDLGPDKAIAIKGFRNPKAEEFSHHYATPGTYIATFVASNSNIYGSAQVVKQITITVSE